MKKQNKGDLLKCLETLIHHLGEDPLFKARKLWDCVETEFLGTAFEDFLQIGIMQKVKHNLCYRERIMLEEARAVLERLERLEKAARRGNLEEVVAILDEKFKYGHDAS